MVSECVLPWHACLRPPSCHSVLQQSVDDYEGIYIPGGHGAMVDFPDNAKLQQIIATLFSKGATGPRRHPAQPFVDKTVAAGQNVVW